ATGWAVTLKPGCDLPMVTGT
ncbi:outer membrane autotransporter barrel domain protein, partial [Escherichia coli 90.0039]